MRPDIKAQPTVQDYMGRWSDGGEFDKNTGRVLSSSALTGETANKYYVVPQFVSDLLVRAGCKVAQKDRSFRGRGLRNGYWRVVDTLEQQNGFGRCGTHSGHTRLVFAEEGFYLAVFRQQPSNGKIAGERAGNTANFEADESRRSSRRRRPSAFRWSWH